MKHTILVPLDGSAASEEALPAAFRLAVQTRSRIHLVRVHQSATTQLCADVSGAGDVVKPGDPQAYLASTAAGCERRWGIRPDTSVLIGDASASIVDYAASAGIDSIVMTTHGAGGSSRAWVGSVAQNVVRRSPVPVMLIHPLSAPDITPRHDTRHIVVALDGSEFSEGSLVPALALAAVTHARITLLGVVMPLPRWLPHSAFIFAETVAGTGRADADVYLECVASGLRAQGVNIDVDTVTNSSPAAGILDYVARHDADAIVLTTHARRGGVRLAAGSVADELLRKASTPIVLCNPHSLARPDVAQRDVA